MSNIIHQTAIVDEGVQLGENNYIGPYCIITGDTIIGDNNVFISHCSIGQEAEHKSYFGKRGITVIGNGNRFSEFVTVHRGTVRSTEIKNNCILLRGSHVGHDTTIDDSVTLSCNVLIGGHSTIMTGCNLGLGSIIHQFSVIGAYSMLGMGCIVPKSKQIEPAMVYVGNPARKLKVNEIGLKRNGIDEKELQELYKSYLEYVSKE